MNYSDYILFSYKPKIGVVIHRMGLAAQRLGITRLRASTVSFILYYTDKVRMENRPQLTVALCRHHGRREFKFTQTSWAQLLN
jgi:hypothetical protein